MAWSDFDPSGLKGGALAGSRNGSSWDASPLGLAGGEGRIWVPAPLTLTVAGKPEKTLLGGALGPRIFSLMAVVALLLSLQVWGGALLGPACAAEPNHAGMVIRFSAAADSHRSWCLQFSQDSISGIEALRLTGLPVVTKTYGSDGEYVCKIGDVGTDAADCPAKDGSYWGYWRMTTEGWRHSGIGASGARVRCGTLEGWAWLQGGTGPAPEVSDFSSVCRSAECKAAPSAVSSPPGGGADTRPAASSDTGAGLPPDAAPNNAPGSPAAGAGAKTDPDAARPTGGSDGSGRAETANRSEGAPPGEAPAGRAEGEAPRNEQAQDGGKGNGPPRPALAADAGKTPAERRRPWELYGGLAAVIALLAATRGYLFWRGRTTSR